MAAPERSPPPQADVGGVGTIEIALPNGVRICVAAKPSNPLRRTVRCRASAALPEPWWPSGWRRCHRVAPASPAWHARFRRARCAGPDARHDRRCRCRALRSRRSCGCRDRGTDTNRTIAPVREPAGTSHPQHQTSPGRVAMRVVGGRDRRGGRNLSEASAALTVGSDLVYRSSCSRR